MLIRQIELDGYLYPPINTKFSFKDGLNFVVGANTRGKTLLLNSISTAFLGTNYQEQWYDQWYHYSKQMPQFYPNQEPKIRLEFDFEGSGYVLRKEFLIGKEAICELYSRDDDGTEAHLCDGKNAIEDCENLSRIVSVGEGYPHDYPDDFSFFESEEYAWEREEIQNLLNQFAPGRWPYHAIFEEPRPSLGQGAVRFIQYLSILLKTKKNGDRNLLLIDEIGHSLDTEYFVALLRALHTEASDSQVILTMPSHISSMIDESFAPLANHFIVLPNRH